MKRYGDFITAEEELAFLTSTRKYIDKEVMPVRMQLDEDIHLIRVPIRARNNFFHYIF
jgi:hypothetical protein